MTIEHDEWLYVLTDSPEKARKHFGLPPNTEVHESGGETVQPTGALRCYAVRAPAELSRAAAAYQQVLGKPPGTLEVDHSHEETGQ